MNRTIDWWIKQCILNESNKWRDGMELRALYVCGVCWEWPQK
jgi:hypothetical protein